MARIKMTIRFRLHAAAVGILLILVIIALSTQFLVRRAFNFDDLVEITKTIDYQELLLREAQKDFLTRDRVNPEFYEKGDSENLEKFDEQLLQIQDNINRLEESKLIRDSKLELKLEELDHLFDDYHATFFRLVDTMRVKGFKDYGMVGEMRSSIHRVEDKVNSKGIDRLTVLMLMLRRHEKDYLLRNDLRYRQKFLERIDEFIQTLDNHPSAQRLTPQERDEIKKLLFDYQVIFLELIEKDTQIGLNDKQGLLKNLEFIYTRIDATNNTIRSTITARSEEKINEAMSTLIIMSLIFSASIIFILLRVSKHILSYMKYLQRYINRLGRGELPEEIVVKREDEIAEMIRSVNILTHNLKNTRAFAIEVGQGKLETQVDVFNNVGDLGGSLVEMRKRLLQVAKEREQNELGAKQRAWRAEGIATFANILRRSDDNLDAFAFDILQHLLQYLGVMQGGIFMINDDDPGDQFFELKAAIAYGERKIMNKRVVEGADLLGNVIKSKKTIYLEELPDDYISISTGLGKGTPACVLITPLMLHDDVLGLIELASISRLKTHEVEFVERIGRDIATAISVFRTHAQTRLLLHKTQEQADVLQERQEEINQQKEELQVQAESLQEANRILQYHQKRIKSSIDYAQTIQGAILPTTAQLNEHFQDHFVMYYPKDIVSGDFYWFSHYKTPEGQADKIFLAAIDCTGHGVPGAFMSLVGHTLISSIVNEHHIHSPKDILEKLNDQVIKILRQDMPDIDGQKANNDGMDVCLCLIEPQTDSGEYHITYTGAKRPLYYHRQSAENEDDISIIKGDRKSIGGHQRRRKHIAFSNQEVRLHKGDCIYLSTDGMIDQNDHRRLKFGSRRLIEVLRYVCRFPMTRQKHELESVLQKHQGTEEQRDDITIFGVRL